VSWLLEFVVKLEMRATYSPEWSHLWGSVKTVEHKDISRPIWNIGPKKHSITAASLRIPYEFWHMTPALARVFFPIMTSSRTGDPRKMMQRVKSKSGCQTPSGAPRPDFCYCQLQFCVRGAPSLTRGRVIVSSTCHLYLQIYSDWLRAGRPRGCSSSPARVKNFLHVIQTGSGVHPTSYPGG
jgi:hypothetical protein